ncbi:F-box domain-containing protein [Mycena kentingensis (nom. inval.)]|nr:F-box domain-containing protein [Mycena kentingensis (nom. inval.)]
MLDFYPESPLAIDPWSVDEQITRRLSLSNEPPSDQEDELVRNSIHSLQALFDLPSSFGVFIDGSTRSLDVHSLLTSRAAVVSPIRRLPAELICEILIEAYASHDFAGTAPHPLWRLSHISRFWRATAIGCPQLWNNICVEIVDPSAETMERRHSLDKLQLLYERAANLPVHVSFTAWPLSTSLDKRWMAGFLADSHRWSTLRVACTSKSFDQLWPLALSGRLALLQSASLHCLEASRRPNCIDELFVNASNLRSLDLTSPSCDSPSPLLILPWTQITSYRASYHARLHLELFLRCPKISRASLGFYPTLLGQGDLPPAYANISALTSRVVAARLKHLTLNAPEQLILDALDAPRPRRASDPRRHPTRPIVLHMHSVDATLVLPPAALLLALPNLRRLVLRPAVVTPKPSSSSISTSSGIAKAERAELLKAIGSMPNLHALEIDDAFWRYRQNAEVLWRCVEQKQKQQNGLSLFRLALGKDKDSLEARAVVVAGPGVEVVGALDLSSFY